MTFLEKLSNLLGDNQASLQGDGPLHFSAQVDAARREVAMFGRSIAHAAHCSNCSSGGGKPGEPTPGDACPVPGKPRPKPKPKFSADWLG